MALAKALVDVHKRTNPDMSAYVAEFTRVVNASPELKQFAESLKDDARHDYAWKLTYKQPKKVQGELYRFLIHRLLLEIQTTTPDAGRKQELCRRADMYQAQRYFPEVEQFCRDVVVIEDDEEDDVQEEEDVNELARERYMDVGVGLLNNGRFDAAAQKFQEGIEFLKEHHSDWTLYKKMYDAAKKRQEDEKAAPQASAAGGRAAPAGGTGGSGGDEKIAFVESKTQRSFNDLVGMTKEKALIEVQFIYPPLFSSVLESGKALLLYGPPGTGKSYMVPAIVNEMSRRLRQNIHLFEASAATIKGKFVGDTEGNLKRLWDTAQRAAVASQSKSIVFIDEIDSIGADRQKTDDIVTRSSVNQLLTLLEGATDAYPNVIFIASTNYPWNLDDAVVRRFSAKIMVDLPGIVAVRGLVGSVMNKRVDWKGDDAKFHADMDEFVGRIANRLVFNKTAATKLREMTLLSDEQIQGFIADGQHEAKGEGESLFWFGYSTSDIKKIMDTALNTIGMRLLKMPLNPSGCVPLPTDASQKACDPREVNRVLRIRPEFVLKNKQVFFDTIAKYGATINEFRYAELVEFSLTGRRKIEAMTVKVKQEEN